MKDNQPLALNGRHLVRMYLALSLMLLLALWGSQTLGNQAAFAQSTPPATSQPTSTPILPATPVCNSPLPLTASPALTEGPYYKAGSPERASLLEAGIPGTPIIVTGYVLTPDCKPIPQAWLDFWQADGKGAYDNSGYKLRGHQFTDDAG